MIQNAMLKTLNNIKKSKKKLAANLKIVIKHDYKLQKLNK